MFFTLSISLPSPALPPPTPHLSEPPVVNVRLNTEARINCPHQPGALLEQYYITWRNSSSNEILADIPNPGHAQVAPSIRRDPRYSIDETTLALVISNVTLLDSDPSYTCELGVVSPQEISRIFTYEESANIELLVYGKWLQSNTSAWARARATVIMHIITLGEA